MIGTSFMGGISSCAVGVSCIGTGFSFRAGAKRAVYVEEEAIWTTYHPTVVCEIETDLEKIEKAVIAESYESLLEMMQ